MRTQEEKQRSLRKLSGLQALGEEMATRLAPYIAMMKGGKAG